MTGKVGIVLGSSPRAWGTRGYHRAQLFLLRFIPTCMGNAIGLWG
ncbi:MAG: hypothetical protein XD74_2147 [Actinobacteria bacterium 66_15]|nr:MAG: hypothetical protein XD74_2147 [Actinobacteria bacterium 66_15]